MHRPDVDIAFTREFSPYRHRDRDGGGGQPRLQIYSVDDQKIVVLTDHDGMLSTHVADEIATWIAREYGLDPTSTKWVDHRPNSQIRPYAEAIFVWDEKGAHFHYWGVMTRRGFRRLVPATPLQPNLFGTAPEEENEPDEELTNSRVMVIAGHPRFLPPGADDSAFWADLLI